MTPDGRYGFAAVLGGGTGGSVIDVLRMAATASGRPVLVRSIPVAGQPLGETITPDGRYLLAADGTGAVVLGVARAESGAAGAVLGMLAAPGGAVSASAIEVATSGDGRYAFVTLEYDQRAAVFNLAAAVSRGFGSADYAGSIPLGQAAVGLAVSPDGRWLYATSEVAAPAQRPVGIRAPAGRSGPALSAGQAARAGIAPGEPPGTLIVVADSNRFSAPGAHADLTVINVADALDGRPAIVGDIPAGLFPRDMTAAPNGTVLVSNFSSGQVETVDAATIP